VVTALYRRYRPEAFAELIGQSQVTAPLMAALRNDRVNHAYLFSGPRGCGKTTSARILARCLNCAEGPTDTPCGKCPSCVELSRDGSGSLDVVEIDAASHNGVDDARELRERAIFAPARDRFKIFILDEAHMVTPQGFNALLKIVEEPPAHVKFIFATTEPDKVIGTIRSRTHHYPFRLVPPAQMLEYLEELCASEKVDVAPGVLSLVVRSGGGSVRDSLSLLDQLIAGSEGGTVEYDRATALLGYTHATLLDEVIDSFAARDAAAVFESVDKVIQSGQDPMRFVEDLLERIRDLIVVLSVGEDARTVLRGVTQGEIDHMSLQAHKFGMAELTHAANTIAQAMTSMSGATSPKLHLELMCAKVLVPASDTTEVGSLARLDRLERRIGVATSAPAQAPATAGPATAAMPVVSAPVVDAPIVEVPKKTKPAMKPVDFPSSAPAATKAPAATPAPVPVAARPGAAQPAAAEPALRAVTSVELREAWPDILSAVNKVSKSAWMIAFALTVVDFEGDVLTLRFASQKDLDQFKTPDGGSNAVRQAIFDLLGVQVRFKAQVAEPSNPPTTPVAVQAPAAPAAAPAAAPVQVHAPAEPEPEPEPDEPEPELPSEVPVAAPAPAEAPAEDTKFQRNEDERYGESLLREMLGAKPINDKNGK
jgi:DNA polymerase-3 subunit gamma/tau